MMRSVFAAVCTIFLFAGVAQAAESFEATACRSGTMTLVQGGKELLILGFELKGILQSKNKMINNASEICVGTMKRMGDETTQMGYCKYMSPNGDINVLEWEGDRIGGKWKFLFGTGKWENIKGKGTWGNVQRAKPIAKGTLQNCITLKGSYALPK